MLKGTKIKKKYITVSIPGAGFHRVRVNKKTGRAIGHR